MKHNRADDEMIDLIVREVSIMRGYDTEEHINEVRRGVIKAVGRRRLLFSLTPSQFSLLLAHRTGWAKVTFPMTALRAARRREDK